MYTTDQVLMTLSALAPTCSTPLPGETPTAQAQRIAAGIATQLAMPGLATAGEWRLRWVGLSQDTENLSYVATNATSNAFAVVLRGTIESLVDVGEDLEVWSVVPFPQGGSANAQISAGALKAFEEITAPPAGFAGDEALTGLTLAVALKLLLSRAPANPTLYVTGHSLGGALATTVALYLHDLALRDDLAYVVSTFAAPTAGVASFQTYFDGVFGDTSYRTYNAYDLVPCAWADLALPKTWYPDPGPKPTRTDCALLDAAEMLPDGNVYVQPTANPNVLNAGFEVHAPVAAATTFVDEVAFQHSNATYLTLLGAPVTPPWPAVHGISPHSGWTRGGTTVTVVGSGFLDGAVVYFGGNPGTNVVVEDDSKLTVHAPAGSLGVVDVRVTTYVGTSPLTFSALYAYL